MAPSVGGGGGGGGGGEGGRPFPHGLSTELFLLMTVSLVLTVSIQSHTDQAGIPSSCSSLLPPALPSLLHTLCGCSRWRSWWLSWISEGGLALQRPPGFHRSALLLPIDEGPFTIMFGSLGFVVDASATDLDFPVKSC